MDATTIILELTNLMASGWLDVDQQAAVQLARDFCEQNRTSFDHILAQRARVLSYLDGHSLFVPFPEKYTQGVL